MTKNKNGEGLEEISTELTKNIAQEAGDQMERGIEKGVEQGSTKMTKWGKHEPKSKKINIHVFTDSTGETTINICNATMSQFPNIEYEIFCWPFVKTVQDADAGLDMLAKHPGIIVYTILPTEVISYIKKRTAGMKGVELVPALEKVIGAFTRYTGVKTNGLRARKSVTDPEYARKMDAIQYAMDHDDGKVVNNLETADIIILGVSRTSKTPTSFYLAYRGYKVINIPFFINAQIPDKLYSTKKPIIVGLLIDPVRLLHLRKNRDLGGTKESISEKYTDLTAIEEELEACRYLFGRLSCPVVDVTNRSVEEVSAHIIKIHNFLRK